MDLKDIDARIAALNELLGMQLRVGGNSFERKVARAGRLLPRWARRDAAEIVQIAQRAGHPKLARMIDVSALTAAETRLTRYLKTLDPKERRTTARLRLLGVVVFNLLIVFALYVFAMWLLGTF